MKILKISVLFLFFIFTPDIFSQEEANLKEEFLEAESYFLFEEYKEALPLYQKIIRVEPGNDNVNFKIGVCYLNDAYQKEKAISYLEKAIKNINPNYKENSFKEKQAPPESWYYLGNAYRINNQLSKAINAYKKFKESVSPELYDIKLVDSQIKSCEVALDVQSTPLYVVKNNLGEEINSRFAEINPIVSGDETTLVFTKKLQFYDAVFYSKKENGKWTYPINLTPSFEIDGNSYCTGLSWNGNEIYIYRSDNFDGNIYVSHKTDEKWSTLEKLNDNINTKFWESHASVSPDGKTLYFTSNRKGGYGGLDIYSSKRKTKDNWETPVNLGPVINSEFNEESPFLTGDGKTLYFSSQGHYNMGGYDIFYSTLLENGKWAKVLNAGYPLNTTGDDVFFVPVKNGEFAYYSMYSEEGQGLNDIYRFEIFSDFHPRKFILKGMTLKGVSAAGVELNELKVRLIDRKTKQIAGETKVNSDGTYALDVNSGEYDLIVTGKGISENKEIVHVPVTHPSNDFKHETIIQLTDDKTTAVISNSSPVKNTPALVISQDYFDVADDNAIAIKLDVDKNTNLQVEVFIDDDFVSLDSFEMNRKKFIYYYRPKEGENKINFTLTDQEGNSETKTVFINFPHSEESLLTSADSSLNKSNNKNINNLSILASGNLRQYLEKLNPDDFNLKTVNDLYNHLLKELPGNNYTLAEVDDLFIKYLSQKDLNVIRNELNEVSTDKLAAFISTIDYDSLNINFSEALIDYLVQSSGEQSYPIDDVDYALTRLTTKNNTSVSDYINRINSYADKNLEYSLLRLNNKSGNFSDPFQITKILVANAGSDNYSINELQSALKKAAINLDVNFLYQSMLFLSEGSLNKTLIDINLFAENIKTPQNLLQYLWIKANDKGYTVNEVIKLVDDIRTNTSKAVEMFRQNLANHATGNLKAFLQSIDLKASNISTFTDLLNYLILNSKFQNYNRETVYKLLLDIINCTSVEEFVKNLKRHASIEMIQALEDLDLTQFSSAYELIQYLIGYTDKYSFTEQDILNLLLKLVLEKGFTQDDNQGMLLEIKKQQQKKLVTTLIIANGLLLVLITLFIVKRKKKEKQKS